MVWAAFPYSLITLEVVFYSCYPTVDRGADSKFVMNESLPRYKTQDRERSFKNPNILLNGGPGDGDSIVRQGVAFGCVYSPRLRDLKLI
jgi:hypothetical protein